MCVWRALMSLIEGAGAYNIVQMSGNGLLKKVGMGATGFVNGLAGLQPGRNLCAQQVCAV